MLYNNYAKAIFSHVLVVVLYSETNLFTSFLAKGMTKMLVGKATAKPIVHPFTKLLRNLVVHPTFIVVMVKVIVESKANVINSAVKNPEYFLLIFKSVTHPLEIPSR